MYHLDYNHFTKSPHVRSQIACNFCRLLLLLFCFLVLKPVYGENTVSTQSIDSLTDTIQQKKITKIEFYIDTKLVSDSEVLERLNEMIYIENGSQYSRYKIQQSVKSLYASQQFFQVYVYHIETPDGVSLKFDLTNVIRIQSITIIGVRSDELERNIDSSLRLKPGDMYVQIIAHNDIDSIKKVCAENGYFSAEVNINLVSSSGRLTYQIDLGEPTYVSEIRILGNKAIFTENIKEKCHTRVGGIYQKSVIDEDLRLIRDLYRKKYYHNTIIDYTFKSGVVTFSITEGTQLLLDFVNENGKPIFKESILRNIWKKLRNNRQESEKDQLMSDITSSISDQSQWIQIVESHFNIRGYEGTTVKLEKITNSPLHVKFTIKLGKRYLVKKVEFEGNDAFADHELLREMDSRPISFLSRHFNKRFFSEQTLETDKKRLRILYEKAGYPKLDVKHELVKQNTNSKNIGEVSIKLTFVEPYKEVIYRCHFIGNSVIDTASLTAALPDAPPVPNARLEQKRYENAIIKEYHELGYIDIVIENPKFLDKLETPTFQLKGDFTTTLDSGMLPQELKKLFNKHELTHTGMYVAPIIGDEWTIQDANGNARYTLNQDREHLSVYEHGILLFEISEGEQISFGSFSFVGDTGVIQKVLTREVAHLQGEIFKPEKLSQAIQNLYGTGIFEPGIRVEANESASIENQSSFTNSTNGSNLMLSEPNVRDVEIAIQKSKPRYFGAGGGFSSADGLRGTVTMNHLNLFRRNIRLGMRGRWGTRGYLYSTTLTEPWLIGRTSGSLQFLGRKLEEDDEVRALQGSFSLSRKLSTTHRLNLEYSYRSLKDISVESSDTTVSSLLFLWRQDSRLPALNPTSGMYNEYTVEYAGKFLGGESNFIKITADSRYYRQLFLRGLVITPAFRIGYTPGLQDNPNSDTELISFERFWAGGSTTVRGYEERGLGPEDITGKHRGNVQFIFNTELRFPIFNPFQGVLFFDTGNVWGSLEDIEYKWLPSSVGVGLRLNIGPIIGGIDYAVPLVSVPDVLTNSVYFRIGNTF